MDTPQAALLRLSDAAELILGERSRNARERLRRMIDSGQVATVRIGQRGDRLVPSTEVRRLLADAEAARQDRETAAAKAEAARRRAAAGRST